MARICAGPASGCDARALPLPWCRRHRPDLVVAVFHEHEHAGHRWKHRDEHDKLHRLLVDVLNVPSRAQRASAGSPIGRIMAASKSIASAQLVEEAAAIVLVHRHQRQSTCWSTLKALGRPNAAVCLLAVPVDALCSWSRRQLGVVVVLAQLQNHCRSRETCSFGTPDAVVCKAARPASAALAAVGERVGIAERAGAVVL